MLQLLTLPAGNAIDRAFAPRPHPYVLHSLVTTFAADITVVTRYIRLTISAHGYLCFLLTHNSATAIANDTRTITLNPSAAVPSKTPTGIFCPLPYRFIVPANAILTFGMENAVAGDTLTEIVALIEPIE